MNKLGVIVIISAIVGIMYGVGGIAVRPVPHDKFPWGEKVYDFVRDVRDIAWQPEIPVNENITTYRWRWSKQGIAIIGIC